MEAQTITARPAKVHDADAIAQVHVEAWRVAYSGLLPGEETLNMRREFWQRALSRPNAGKVDVAEDDTGIIASCSYGPTRDEGDAAEIYALYVHPDRWRRGAGRLLCERALRAAAQRGHEAMTLWVMQANERARAFYERLGFRRDGAERRNTRFLATPFDEMRYRKPTA